MLFGWACLGGVCVRRKRPTARWTSSNVPKLGQDLERFEQGSGEEQEWEGDK